MEAQHADLQMQESTTIMPELPKNQLLATKFYVPVALGPLITRPRLTALLNKSLECPFTLVSAPAGFGKTTLLSTWKQSLPTGKPLVAWVSLDEEDNDPQLFWSYVLSALDRQHPHDFTPLLNQLQSSQCLPLKHLLTAFINLLAESTEHFVLILDDYQVITEQQIHTTLMYLLEHLPSRLHIILATRTLFPLPLSRLRICRQMLEVRTDQLRCTVEETRAFFRKVIGTHLPDETIQQVTDRTEGWLVGMQLLGLSLAGSSNPVSLLEELGGDQRYILDYLIQEVLKRQTQEVQIFLLSTCILERLTASLCDAVMQQTGSQQMLQQLEQANLFVVSLDSKRQWYRYHALFAEALRYRLEQMQPDFVITLHHRASLWYAEHHQTTEAILHAFNARQWEWAANLIEREHLPLMSFVWGADKHALARLQHWIEQLPADIIRSRPGLCLACTQLLWTSASHSMLQMWLDIAEAALTASFIQYSHADVSHTSFIMNKRQEQQNLLAEVIAMRAVLQSYQEDGPGVFARSKQALSLLSTETSSIHVHLALAQLIAYYASYANDAVAAVESGLRGGLLAQAAGLPALAIGMMGTTARYMIGAGRLHEAYQLTEQAKLLGIRLGSPVLPEVGWPAVLRANILCEWNALDVARTQVKEAVSLCEEAVSHASSIFLLCAYAMLARVCLSCRDYDTACSALEHFERIGMHLNQHIYLHIRSLFTTIDQVRLWLACGDLKAATRWAETRDLTQRHSTPFACEREEVAYVRVLLAKEQPNLALQRLETVLQRATSGQRWGHVIEIRILQALAYQMHQQKTQALDTLLEAVRLAEPEGYIRSFVDEGASMEALLYQLRKQERKYGPTPYLDTLLAAFQQEDILHTRAGELSKVQQLSEPLSERELEVLQLLAQGASNQEIARTLVIAIDTVKRHVSHIFSKLGVQNRVQAIRQAQTLGLLAG